MLVQKRFYELGNRIKDFRLSQGFSQERFGKELGVSRPQVSAWENGKESPSNERLLDLGNRAPYPENLWFWTRAGLDPKKIDNAIRASLTERLKAPALAELVHIPRWDAASLLRWKKTGEKGSECAPT